ncbi:hypothetical protein [Streptomyces sp. bgisy130]|uniref:hypothetical protein n=1 Tax=Streptomyces sp. bgisy130 TaxID=3413788 RepID=UPI003F4A54E8
MSYSPQPAPAAQQPHLFVPPPAERPPVTQRYGLKIAVGAGCALVVLALAVTVGGSKKDGAKPAPTVTVTVASKAG